MKVKATKKMATYLQEQAEKQNKGFEFAFEKLTIDEFKWYCDISYYNHEADFDEATNKFNVIRVIYPANCYACDRYLTTRYLMRLFRESDGTAEDFAQKVFEEIEI